MPDSLLDQIEQDVLNDSSTVASALRKCVALGGRSGSEALRDWATRELEGYEGEEDIPDYRIVAAPIRIDGIAGMHKITGQAFPPSALPEVAREHIREQVSLRAGAGQLEELARMPEIKIGLPGGGDLARIINAETGNRYQHIDMIYWAVSPAVVRGVLDRIRTALIKLVAELRAVTPDGQSIPTEAAATQAMNFVISGKRAKVNVNAAQASGPSATATTTVEHPPETDGRGFWTFWRRVGAGVVGVATIAGTVFAGIQLF